MDAVFEGYIKTVYRRGELIVYPEKKCLNSGRRLKEIQKINVDLLQLSLLH